MSLTTMRRHLPIIGILLMVWSFLPIGAQQQQQQQQLQLALAVSSPMFVLLSPLIENIDRDAFNILEISIGTHIVESTHPEVLSEMNIAKLFTVEVIVQSLDLLPELDATSVKFFAVATVKIMDEQNDSRANMNLLIEQAFATGELRDNLLVTIRKRASLVNNSSSASLQQLQTLESIVLATSSLPELSPTSSPNKMASSEENKNKRLSTLDISMIVVASAILMAVVLLIFQLYWDRAWVENQRHQVLNSTNTGHDETILFHSEEEEDEKRTYIPSSPDRFPLADSRDDFILQVSPSAATMSTISASIYPNPMMPQKNNNKSLIKVDSDNLEPQKSNHQTETTAPDKVKTLSEAFENKWFRKLSLSKDFVREKRKKDTPCDSYADGKLAPNDETGSASSEDVFQVDIAAAESSSIADDSASKYSDVTEWMRTIQVVTVDSQSSTAMSNRTSASNASPPRSTDSYSSMQTELRPGSLTASSIDHVSLEQSLESSDIHRTTDDTREDEVVLRAP